MQNQTSSKSEQLIKRSQEIKDLIKQDSQNSWEKCAEDKKRGIVGYKLKGAENIIHTRSVCEVSYPIQQIKYLFENSHEKELAKVFDEDFMEFIPLQKITDNLIIAISTSHCTFSKDTYSVLLEGSMEENGSIFFFGGSTSVPEHLQHEVEGQLIKLEEIKVNYEGWIVTNLGEGKVRIQFISNIELDAPGFIKSSARNSRGIDQMKSVCKYLEKINKK